MKRIPHQRTSAVQRAHLGRLFYRGFWRPARLLQALVTKNFFTTFAVAAGARAMRRTASRLRPAAAAGLPATPAGSASITYLTGRAYWWQTAWCGHSLFRHLTAGTTLELVDDGTLSETHAATLHRLFPQAIGQSAAAIEAQLRLRLPPEKYPLIWYYRREKPIFRKFTDIFGRDDAWRLLLDSDMLFFRRPQLLLDWLRQPDRPVYMRDVRNAYGYSPELLQRLAGRPIPDRVNIGIFGFSGRLVDWDRVEAWLKILIETEGLKYNLTQALAALHLAGRDCLVLPREDYLLLPSREQAMQPTQVLQHYVAESKEWYFREAWRAIGPRGENSSRHA